MMIRNGFKFDIKINPGDWELDLIRYISIGDSRLAWVL